MAEQKCGATCGATAIDVAPPIANHEAGPKIEIEGGGRSFQHPWIRFAEFRAVLAVIANLNAIDGQRDTHMSVNRFNFLAGGNSAPDIWLVAGNDKIETGLLQTRAGFHDIRQQLEVANVQWWK